MKKLLLTLGATAAIAAPVASVVACGDAKPATPTNTKPGQVGTTGSLKDVKYMADWDFTPSFLEQMTGATGEDKVKLDEALSDVVGIGSTKDADTYDVVLMGGPTFTTLDETAGEMLTIDSDADKIVEAMHKGATSLPKAKALPLRDLYERQYPILQVQEQFGLMPGSFDKEHASLDEKKAALKRIVDFRNRNAAKDNSFRINVERALETIKGLRAAGKKVNIIAPSYGAFLAEELITMHPEVLDMVQHILIDSGRINYASNNFGDALKQHSYPSFSDDGKTIELASDSIDRLDALDAGAELLKDLDAGKTFTNSEIWKGPKYSSLKIDTSQSNEEGNKELFDKVYNGQTVPFVSIQSLSDLNFETTINKLDAAKVKSKIIFSVADKDRAVGVLDSEELAYAKSHFDFISTPGDHMAGLYSQAVIDKLK